MGADSDVLLEPARLGFADDHARLGRGRLRRWHIEIALGQGGDDVGYIGSIAAAAEQMIGAGERDETFGMLGGGEDATCVVDTDEVVGR